MVAPWWRGLIAAVEAFGPIGPSVGGTNSTSHDECASVAGMGWSFLEWLEGLSYLVTVVGLPFAILVFLHDHRRERQNEEEQIYERLSDEYSEFLKLILENADLQLMRAEVDESALSDEQKERRRVLFELLISIFERAYLLVYEEKMKRQTQRLWMSWEDYMRSWCRRNDFRSTLPQLLEGEDPEFVAHIERIAAEERSNPLLPSGGATS